MGVESWSPTPANNNAAPPNGAPEGMAPSAVNDALRQMMASIRVWAEQAQWFNPGLTPTRVSGSQFTLPGDVTGTWDVNRKVLMTGSGTAVGTISASVYSSPNTTITITEGNVPATLSAVNYHVISGALSNNPYTASQILAMLLTVDGTGTGLDADTVDGVHASSFQLAAGYTAADVLSKLLSVDGTGSGIDADMVDGQHAAAFAQASHSHSSAQVSGSFPASQLPLIGNLQGVVIQADPGGTPSGSPGTWFLYY